MEMAKGAPRVGLTTYGRDASGRYSLPADYVEAVRRAGGLPLLLPPGEPRAERWLEIVDALILTGGGDVDPALYGGALHASVERVDRSRDESEIALARAAVEGGVPCLCICRGAQVLNVALGGTLVEHLPDEVGEEVAHRGPTLGGAARSDSSRGGAGSSSGVVTAPSAGVSPCAGSVLHAVRVEAGTRLAAVLGTAQLEAPSMHHQAIRALAPGLVVAARAPDGTIEAVELRSHPWLLGVQWHPEMTASADPLQQRLFDALVAFAREARRAGAEGVR